MLTRLRHNFFDFARLRSLARNLKHLRLRSNGTREFDPLDPKHLANLLNRFDLSQPRHDQNFIDFFGAMNFVLAKWIANPQFRIRYPFALSGGEDSKLISELIEGISEGAACLVREAFAYHPFDRVRQVFELRADVRNVFPLGLTPAQRGEYAAWLFRYGRNEYGFHYSEILWYLFGLTEDRSFGLADTYLFSPHWQQAVPDAIREQGWHKLLIWLNAEYPQIVGRWLKRAQRPNSFDNWIEVIPEKTINLLGHFKYDSGLQEEALQHVAAIEEAEMRTCVRDVPVSYPREWREDRPFHDLELGSITLIKTGAQEPIDEVYERAGLFPQIGPYRIACWSWELEEFPQSVIAHAELIDEVWTPSEFCARSVREVLPNRPVFVMPPAITLPRMTPRPRSDLGLPASFLFLFAFDMASGMARKNPLGLIRAFQLAFESSEPVHLAIKVSRGHAHPQEFLQLQQAARDAGATLIDRILPREEVTALFAACDCYVSLHRSEGFGLTLAEAMKLGKPTIATAYSGNLDFMDAECSYLVPFERVQLDRDYAPYPAGAWWAEPSVAEAARLMRRVYLEREEARQVAEEGRNRIATYLSRSAASQRMMTRIREILANRGTTTRPNSLSATCS